MKRLFLGTAAAAILAMSWLNPFHSSDVAQLLPLQALTVDVVGGRVCLDGGAAKGSGPDLEAALEDLRHGAAGQVFLQTAEYVIVSERAVGLLPQLAQWQALRPATAVCAACGPLPHAEAAAAYLQSHSPGVTLQQVHGALLRREAVTLAVLEQTEGGLRLYGTAKDR